MGRHRIFAVALCGLSLCTSVPVLAVSGSPRHVSHPRANPPARLGTTSPSRATARGRACHATGPAGSAPPAPAYVINPADYGADPTGATDSSAVLQHCVELLWNTSRTGSSGSVVGSGAAGVAQRDLGGATLELGGGIFLLSSPVVFPATGARNFQVRGGTLRAARAFPVSRFLLELNYTEKAYVENAAFHDVVFDGGDGLRGGGLPGE